MATSSEKVTLDAAQAGTEAVLAGLTYDHRTLFPVNVRAHATVGLGDLVPYFKTQTWS
jgi:hypothetical protein